MIKRKQGKLLLLIGAMLFLAGFLVFDEYEQEIYDLLFHQKAETYSLSEAEMPLSVDPYAIKTGGEEQILNKPLTQEEKECVQNDLKFRIADSTEAFQTGIWEDTKGEWYLFLPGFAKDKTLQLINTGEYDLYIDDKKIESQDKLKDWQEEYCYEVRLNDQSDTIKKTTLQIVVSSEVPVLSITTKLNNLSDIQADKEAYTVGNALFVQADGSLSYQGAIESLTGRGNSTWGLLKKPFEMKLSRKTDLLGLPKTDSYCLLANAYDDTNLRNKLVLDMASLLGLENTPEYQIIDLYIDGEYQGNYYLTQKVKDAADLSKEGILFERELESRYEQEANGFMTKAGDCYVVHKDGISEDSLHTVASNMQLLEDALEEENGIHQKTGKSYLDLIDLDSFVKKYLVEEVSKNYDGGVTSSFFYVNSPEDKIHAGPVWDYDVAFGNCNLDDMASDPKGVTKLTNHIYGTGLFAKLYEKQEFYARMVSLYEQIVLPYLDSLIESELDNIAMQYDKSNKADARRWENLENRYRYYESMEDNLSYLKYYIKERRDFLNEVWLEGETYYQLTFVVEDMVWQKSYAKYGELPEQIPDPSWDQKVFVRWYTKDGVPFDFRKPVYEDQTFYALWQDIAPVAETAE